MAALSEGYKPPAEFVEDSKDPLVDLDLSGSKELWLIQWPMNQDPGFHGQEVTLDLGHDGKLGSLEGSSGKVYDLVSHSALGADATVFQSSSTGAKIVGKISRRVSVVRYPEPSEFVKDPKSSYSRTPVTSSKMAPSSNMWATPSRSSMSRGDISLGNRSGTSSRSGKQSGKSGLSEERGQPSKLFSSKRRVESGLNSSGSPKKSKTKTQN